ncbi:hypothetical protein ABW20_dc0103290 [Dactylellina cionopaga]|nr:hypothetical protein ABW20_dc0103290 [Dactylellina cionopaga]
MPPNLRSAGKASSNASPKKAPTKGTKRKREAVEPPEAVEISPPKGKRKSKKVVTEEEKKEEELEEELEEQLEEQLEEEPPRLKKFRPQCPKTVEQRWDRMRAQRMFCLGRERDERNLREDFKIAGSTGNVYTVTLANVPTCDCPDSKKNGTCKHILFVMVKILRARAGLSYQAALLNSEIRDIFAHSSVPVEGDISGDKRKRKPLDEDECPVCYEPFREDDNSILFCIAQCGSNIHKECFRQWAASKDGGQVTCVMCRTPWAESSVDQGEYGKILQSAKVGNEGYLNVAQEMGISTHRDASTYHGRHGYRYGRYY